MDQRQDFLLKDLNIRGSIVVLSHSWKEVLHRRSYPERIQVYLAELTAATLLMSNNLKFNGKLTAQYQGDLSTDISLLVSQCDEKARFRSVAKYKSDEASLGSGTLVMSIKADNQKEPYQGIVSVNDGSIVEAIETYFVHSEQLKTHFNFAYDSGLGVCGIMLQAMPESIATSDDWLRLKFLIDTLSLDELLSLNCESVLKRLFAEDDMIVYPSHPVSFFCQCSDERTLSMLSSLSQTDLEEIILEEKPVHIACDFCGCEYVHGLDTVKALLDYKKHPN